MCTPSPASAHPDHARPTLGAILRAFLCTVQDSFRPGLHKLRVLWNLARCGTGELGEVLYECHHCGSRHWTERACGDRHCPRCLASRSRQWLHHQMQSLIPATYYHWVFTLPEELNPLVLANQAKLYKLLFDCTAQTLIEFARHRLGGDPGITAVLHTWGQKLDFHPHIHCIVTGGALSADRKRWRSSRQRKYLFPVKAVRARFQGKFLDGLRALIEAGELQLPHPQLTQSRARKRWLSSLYAKRWHVYAKRPFGGPQQVLRYLANYTHRVALSNRRILAYDEDSQTVTFTWRDYRDSTLKQLTLTTREFVRRFCLHILPPRLVRVRHYGILANNRRRQDIEAARAILARRGHELHVELPKDEGPRCPKCGKTGVCMVGFTEPDGTFHSLARSPPLHDIL